MIPTSTPMNFRKRCFSKMHVFSACRRAWVQIPVCPLGDLAGCALREQPYMRPPKVLVDTEVVAEGVVWKIKKALYGLRTSLIAALRSSETQPQLTARSQAQPKTEQIQDGGHAPRAGRRSRAAYPTSLGKRRPTLVTAVDSSTSFHEAKWQTALLPTQFIHPKRAWARIQALQGERIPPLVGPVVCPWDRTHDRTLTKRMLCQLSYRGHVYNVSNVL